MVYSKLITFKPKYNQSDILLFGKGGCCCCWGGWGWGGGTVLGWGIRNTSILQVGQVCCRWNQERRQLVWKMWLHGSFLHAVTMSSRHMIQTLSPDCSSSSVASGYLWINQISMWYTDWWRARGPGLTWRKLTERDWPEWKLTTVGPQERTWRSSVRSAMCAACQLPGRGPTDVNDAPAPAC